MFRFEEGRLSCTLLGDIQEKDENAVELPILPAMKYSFEASPESLTSSLKQKERIINEKR